MYSRSRAARALSAWSLLVCSFLPMTWAQENTGRIDGIVVDDTGAVIPGARLTVATPSAPGDLTTTSDSTGSFVFPNLPPGIYTVTVSKVGFSTFKQQSIQVLLGSKISLTTRLSIGSISQTVEVAETAISLDATSSRTSTNITASEFDLLPKGRSFHTLLNMTPGARLEPKSGNAGVGGFSVDGSGGAENVFIIDGMNTTNLLNGELRANFSVPFEFIAEFQVKSAGFEAEYGGANGGVVNVATRSGTRDYHGDLFYQFNNDAMNPSSHEVWQSSPLNRDLAEFYKQPVKDKFTNQFPGFRFGGPVVPFGRVRDKLFFSVGLSPSFTSTTRTVPYASGTRKWTRDDAQFYGLARVDYAVSSKLQLASSFTWSPTRQTGSLPNADPRRPAPTNDQSILGGYLPSKGLTTSATYTISPTLVVQGRYGYTFFNDKIGNYGVPSIPQYVYNTATSAAPGVPGSVAGPAGFQNISSNYQVLFDILSRHTVYIDVSKIANIGGRQHTFKGGYTYDRLANNVSRDYLGGRFFFNWGDVYNRGSINNAQGTYGYYTWEDGVKIFGTVHSQQQGFYFQDDWKASRRLTLNLGIRFENEFLPPYRAEQGGVKVANPVSFNWASKIAPRLGGAYDVMGNGKWKISASYGHFFDVMKYNLARGSFGGELWISHVYQLNSTDINRVTKSTPGALGKEIINYDNRTIPINAQGQLDGIEPNLKPFQTRSFNVALDHELTQNTIIGARYVHKWIVDAIEDIGVVDSQDNEIYLIGNPGKGQTRDPKSAWGGKTPDGKEFLVPVATRRYDAVEIYLRGRVWKNTLVNTSLNFSRLYGNYAGLGNSDENGRQNSNNDRSFDSPYYYFDASGSQKNREGVLGTDRPVTFKMFLSKSLKIGRFGEVTISPVQNIWSGTPISTLINYYTAPTYPFGRGDMGRTPTLFFTDLVARYSFKIKERYSASFEVNATNVLNNGGVTNIFGTYGRQTLPIARLPIAQFFKGYDAKSFFGQTAGLLKSDVQYGLPIAYQAPRNVRLGFRFTF